MVDMHVVATLSIGCVRLLPRLAMLGVGESGGCFPRRGVSLKSNPAPCF